MLALPEVALTCQGFVGSAQSSPLFNRTALRMTLHFLMSEIFAVRTFDVLLQTRL